MLQTACVDLHSGFHPAAQFSCVAPIRLRVTSLASGRSHTPLRAPVDGRVNGLEIAFEGSF